MTAHHRRLFVKKWTRLLHIYLSMLGLATILFFAVTGFMLNHDTWFGLDDVRTEQSSGQIPASLLQSGDRLAVVEQLRAEQHVSGRVDTFETDEKEIRIVFKAPGKETDVVVDRQSGAMAISRHLRGPLVRLTELHKGTDAGPGWRLVLDATSILLILSSLTGLMLWFFVPRWRTLGLIAMIASIAACLAVYWWLVP